MTYFTSDCHFWHNNIISYCNRPFGSVEEMNEALIKNWNDTVNDDDDIYVLGDFFMGQDSRIEEILERLNGKIHLIVGNHDDKRKIKRFEAHGIDCKKLDYFKYKGRFFILCHFPMANKEFLQMVREDNSECVVLYGHIHDKAPKGYVDGTYHVGVDTNDYKPISIEQIWQECWPEEIMTEEVKKYKEEHEHAD